MTKENAKILYEQWMKSYETGFRGTEALNKMTRDECKKRADKVLERYPDLAPVVEEEPIKSKGKK